MIRTMFFPVMKKYRVLMISMLAVSCLGIALMIGLSGAYKTLDISLNRFVKDYNYTDITVTVEQNDINTLSGLDEIEGVAQINARKTLYAPFRLKDGKVLSLQAMSYREDDFQKFHVWESKESSEYPNVAVEYKFAKENNLSAGDIINLRLYGEYKNVCVGSLVSSPECLTVVRDEYSWGENSDFGYIFVPEKYADETQFADVYNQILIKTDKNADNQRILNDIEEKLRANNVSILNSSLYKDSPVFRIIDINLKPVKTLSILVPAVFFISMIAVIILFLTQIISQCRRDIGIMRACGISKIEIRLLYCAITFVITLIACVIGIIIGYVLMRITGKLYSDFFELPHLFYELDIKRIFVAVGVTITSGQIAAFVSTMRISNILPSEAMSREAPSVTNIPYIFRKMMSGFSPAMKFGVTSVFRNVKRFIFSTFCVAISMMLILTSMSFNVSKNSIIEQLFDKRTHYEAQIFLDSEPSDAEINQLKELSGVSDPEQMTYHKAEIMHNGKTADATICGIKKDSKMVSVYDLKQKEINVSDDGIIIEKHVADELGIKKGDTVDINGVKLTVTELSYQSVNRIQYVSEQTASKLGTADKYCILCNAKNEHTVLNCASKWKGYSYTNFTNLIREGNEKTFRTYSVGVYVLIGFAVLMGFLVVFNTTQMNLFDQKKSLSVLRSLGFQIADISRMWFMQTIIQFTLSCAVGLSAGAFVARYALSQMTTDGREYPFVDEPMQFIITAGIVLVYIIISHFVAMNGIKKWDLVENIKEKE